MLSRGETTHYILCVALLLQNVFAVHRKGDTTTLGPEGSVKLKNPPAQRPVKPKNLFAQPFYTTCGIRRVPLCPKGGKTL